jgi:hypothetical protein
MDLQVISTKFDVENAPMPVFASEILQDDAKVTAGMHADLSSRSTELLRMLVAYTVSNTATNEATLNLPRNDRLTKWFCSASFENRQLQRTRARRGEGWAFALSDRTIIYFEESERFARVASQKTGRCGARFIYIFLSVSFRSRRVMQMKIKVGLRGCRKALQDGSTGAASKREWPSSA